METLVGDVIKNEWIKRVFAYEEEHHTKIFSFRINVRVHNQKALSM